MSVKPVNVRKNYSQDQTLSSLNEIRDIKIKL